mgnify:CR=1 FL=1
MKTYTKPEIEINALENTDVITASGGLNATKFTQTKGYNVVDNF